MGSESGPKVPKTSERFGVPDTDVGSPTGTAQPLRFKPATAAYSILAGHSALIVKMNWPAGRQGGDEVRFQDQPRSELKEKDCEHLQVYLKTIAAVEYDPNAPHVVRDGDRHWINYEAHIPPLGGKPGYIIPFTVLKDTRNKKDVRDVVVLFVVPTPPAPPGSGTPVAPRNSAPVTNGDARSRRKSSATSRPVFGELPGRRAGSTPRAARSMLSAGAMLSSATPSWAGPALAASAVAAILLVGSILNDERSRPSDEPRFYSALISPPAPKPATVTKVATAPSTDNVAPEPRPVGPNGGDNPPTSPSEAVASTDQAVANAGDIATIAPAELTPPPTGASTTVTTTVKIVEPDGSSTSTTTTVHTEGQARVSIQTRPTAELDASTPTTAAVTAVRPRTPPSARASARDGRPQGWERSGAMTGPYGRDGPDGQYPRQ